MAPLSSLSETPLGEEEGQDVSSSSKSPAFVSPEGKELRWLASVVKSPASLIAAEENAKNRRLALSFAVSRLHALVSGTRRGREDLQSNAFLNELSRLGEVASAPCGGDSVGEGVSDEDSALGALTLRQLWAILDEECTASLKGLRRRIRSLPKRPRPSSARGEGETQKEGDVEPVSLKKRRWDCRKDQDAVGFWSVLLPEVRRALFSAKDASSASSAADSGASDAETADEQEPSNKDGASSSEAESSTEEEEEEEEKNLSETTDLNSEDGHEHRAEEEADASTRELLNEIAQMKQTGNESSSDKEEQSDVKKAERLGAKRHSLDDEFFSLEEMNKFAEEGEIEMQRQARKNASSNAEAEDDVSEEEEEEEEEEDEDEAEARALLFEGLDAPGAEGKEVSYEEFFGKKDSRRKSQDEEEEEDEEEDDASEEEEGFEGFGNAEPLDAEDRRLEATLRRLQREIEEQDKKKRDLLQQRRKEKASAKKALREDALLEEEESAESDASLSRHSSVQVSQNTRHSRAGRKEARQIEEGTSATPESISAMETRIAALEEELVAPKSWELTGEVWAKQRPKDALLGLEDLTVPLPYKPGQDAEEEGLAAALSGLGDSDAETNAELQRQTRGGGAGRGAGNQVEVLSAILERIVKGRIESGLFDDVERKAPPPPPDIVGSNKAGAAAASEAEAELNTSKPTEGLGDLYAREYQQKVLGKPDPQKEQLDAEKTALLELFGKLMYKLDSLSHSACMPRPAAVSSADASCSTIPSIRVEEAVPVFVAGLAPTLDAAKAKAGVPKVAKTFAESSREDRRAERRSKKARRVQALRRRIESGELTPQQAAERAERLKEKNLKAKAEKKEKRATGLTHSQAIKEMRKGQRRVKTVELLADALRSKAKKADSLPRH